MSTTANAASPLANLRRSVQGTAKHYIRLLWGEQGPPCALRLAALEDLARQIGDLLANELVEQTLDRQAFAPYLGDAPAGAGVAEGRSGLADVVAAYKDHAPVSTLRAEGSSDGAFVASGPSPVRGVRVL
jgi:hypothetical protein